jgi:hypothetical protein
MDKRLKCKTHNFENSRRKYREQLHDVGLGMLFLDIIPQNTGNKSKHRQKGFYQIIQLLHSKENNQVKKQSAEWKNISKLYM